MIDEPAARYLIENNHRFFCAYTRMILEQAGGQVDVPLQNIEAIVAEVI